MKSMFSYGFQAMGRTTVPIMRGVPMQRPAPVVPQTPEPTATQVPLMMQQQRGPGFAPPAYPGRGPFSGSCPVCH